MNLEFKAKIPGRYWGKVAEEEQKVIVCDGYLAQGIMDKSQLGASANGLVHAVYEVYGVSHSGNLLSILSRLLTIIFRIIFSIPVSLVEWMIYY